MWHDCFFRMSSRFCVVKVPVFIRLQSHREFVKVFRDLMVAVEALVPVRFVVAVEVVEPNDLIAANDVDFFLNTFHAQRLKQSSSNPLPGERFAFRIGETVDSPNGSVPRRYDRGPGVRQKVDSCQSQLAVPRVVGWAFKNVDCKRTSIITAQNRRGEFFRIVDWPAAFVAAQVFRICGFGQLCFYG